MQQAGYHQVNLLAQQFKQELDSRDNDIITILKGLEAHSVAPTEQTETALSTLTPATHQVNATSTEVQLEMINLLKKIEQKLNQPSLSPSAPQTRPKKGRKTPDNATWPRRNTSKYCWTHGACGHDSPGCQAKATGHKDDATLTDRKGGSNAYCQPATST